MELLEGRRVLAVLTVNSLGDNPADTGALTFRDALTLVNNAGSPGSLGQASMPNGWASQISGAFGNNDTIQFDSSLFGSSQQTITLASGALFSNTSVSITGPGADKLAIADTAVDFYETFWNFGTTSVSGLTFEELNNGNQLNVTDICVTGGVSNSPGGTMTITHSTISGAQGKPGIQAEGRMTIVNSTISNNDAGILCFGGTLSITDSTISDNVEDTGGYNFGDGTVSAAGIINVAGSVTISGSTICNNQNIDSFGPLGHAGGIINDRGTVIINDSTITGNEAAKGTGAIENLSSLTLNNSTVVANSSNSAFPQLSAAGIFNDDQSSMFSAGNSIIAGNTGGGGDLLSANGATFDDLGGNLIGGDPMLGPLQDNGGPTQTMLPVAGSPAIDAGNTSLVTGPTDQRGFARVVGAVVDSGAVESSAVPAVSDLAITGQAPATADWHGEISFTLAVTNNGPNDQSDVSLSDTLPDNATLVSLQQTSGADAWSLAAPPAGDGGSITAWTGSLASGDSATFTLVVQHNPAANFGYVTNVVDSATLGPLTGDPVTANNSVTLSTSLINVPTSTSVSVDDSGASVVGQPLTFIATVSSVLYSYIAAPTGTVTFYDGGTPIGTADVVNYGGGGELAYFTVPLSTAGNHSITAAYTSGDATFAPSAVSAPISQIVNDADTLTTVTSTAARSTAAVGENVRFTAKVSVVAPGAGAPTGTVQFQVDGQNFGNPVPLDANDDASISTSAIPIGNHRVTAIYEGDPNFRTSTGLLPGTISTLAGNGTQSLYVLPTAANNTVLLGPNAVAADSSGDIFIADGSQFIRRLDAKTGIVSTFGPTVNLYNVGYSAQVGLACDAAGNLYIADPGDNVVEKVSPEGVVTTLAGTFGPYYGYDSGDGGPATAATLAAPSGLAFDASGDLFIVDAGSSIIREINTAGIISTVAGGGSWWDSNGNYIGIGDGGLATAAVLDTPTSVAVDAAGNLFIADSNNDSVRKVDAVTGIISTVAGGYANWGYSGDGGPATSAQLSYPDGLAFDAAGDLYISDHYNQVVREVTPAGVITTVAGNGTAGKSGDGGSATSAQLSYPGGLAFDAAGNLLVTDSGNGAIRKVDTAGAISTVVGGGTLGTAGNGGPATDAPLNFPGFLAVDAAGNLFVADGADSVVREVSPEGIITTVAGNGTYGYSGDGGLATAAQLNNPNGLALDAAGDLFIADAGNNVVREVTPAGIITTVAGNGAAGYGGDGGPAADASLHLSGYFGVSGVPLALDDQGDLFIGDDGNGVIREVNAAGVISTVTLPATFEYGSTSLSTTGYFGTNAGELAVVRGLAVDAAGDLFISIIGEFSAGPTPGVEGGGVLELSQAGVLSTVAGDLVGFPGHSADGGPALGAELGFTGPLAFDAAGDLLIADAIINDNGVIRAVSPTGIISTIAGAPIFDSNGNYINHASNGDGGPATSAPLYANGVAADAAGDLFIAEDIDIRKVSPSLVVTQDATTTAVTSNTSSPVFGQAVTLTVAVDSVVPGVGTPTGTVQLMVDGQDFGDTLPLDANGNASLSTSALPVGIHTITAVYNGDAQFQGSTGVLASGTIETVVGTGVPGYSGDGGPAIDAQLNILPEGLAFDSAGDLYIADLYNQVVRKVSPDGIITTVAGNGTEGYRGDGGQATNAELDYPFDVAVDWLGDLFIADTVNNVIREVFPDGTIATVAGNGSGGYSGDGGYATDAELFRPGAIAVDQFGNLFIADESNNVIREVTPDGIIHTVVGNGSVGYTGDGGPATDAALGYPADVKVDAAGDLFFSDYANNVIREVTPDGIIHTVAGNGTAGYSGDGGSATAASLNGPSFLALDAAGDLFICDTNNNVVREVRAGIISTVAGTGTAGYTGDGGPAAAAQLNGPAGVAVDAYGDLFISDSTNNIIREVTPTLYVSPDGSTTTVASSDSTSVVGQSVTFTATVVAAAPGSGTPSGTVTFWDGSTELGTATLDANGQATFTTSGLSLGIHTITVSYSGSADFNASVSLAISQTVLSSKQEAGVIVDQVNALTAAGIVNKGDGNALVSKLSNAIASLNRGSTTSGINQLNAFINQVQALVKGHKLDATDAQTLINSANLAIAAAALK